MLSQSDNPEKRHFESVGDYETETPHLLLDVTEHEDVDDVGGDDGDDNVDHEEDLLEENGHGRETLREEGRRIVPAEKNRAVASL